MSSTSLAGKTILITGGARGIGAATAQRVHAAGANVALVGLEPERLQALVESLGTERAAWFEADVTDKDALQSGIDGAAERFGGLDVVIANAGVHFIGAFQSAPLEHIERELEINLTGVIRTGKFAMPHLLKSKGYLLNIASLAAAGHAPMMSAYSASKAGVEAFSNSIRTELAPAGVDVGCAYFGFIDTDMVRGSFDHPSTKELDALMPKFLGTSVHVDQAVDAIEKAIVGRSARTWAPKFVGGALVSRGITQPLTERRMMTKSAQQRIARAVELAGEHEAAGPAGTPVA